MARTVLNGRPVSPGVAVGPALVATELTPERVPERRIPAAEAEAALQALEEARQRAIEGLKRIQAATTRELGIQDAAIYGAQISVLQDPDALKFLRAAIQEQRLAPESAIQALLDRFTQLFESMEGGDVQGWVADLRDPWVAVLRELGAREAEQWSGEGEAAVPLILVVAELSPAVVGRHHRTPLAGIVAARGGRFSHGAVLARSFGIPCVSGIEGAETRIRSGDRLVVYGDQGRVVVGAGEDELREARAAADQIRAIQEALTRQAREECRTADGVRIRLEANIESPRDLDLFDPDIVDGVGLFRTEFAFMERRSFPSAREQQRLYRRILEKMEGRPVVFRTLDTGNDKPLPYFETPAEANPALGWRGLRVSLEFPDLFLVQLKALVRARAAGRVRILLPMVTTLEEMRSARECYERVLDEAGLKREEAPPLGAMIEVPSAAVVLPALARECDFLSVGTNDLIQYLFAVDRDNGRVADLYQPYHPAHLQVLQRIARVCRDAGKPFSACGEMAGYMAGALFLVGAGFRTLSIAPAFVPKIQATLREASLAELEALAARAADCEVAEESTALLEEAAARLWERAVERARATDTASG